MLCHVLFESGGGWGAIGADGALVAFANFVADFAMVVEGGLHLSLSVYGLTKIKGGRVLMEH